jgi:hypothetical protein
MGYNIDFTPSRVCGQFMADDAKMRVLMGCVGSGKSVTSSFEVIRRAGEQEPNAQGIRKTRAAVVRETARQNQNISGLVSAGGVWTLYADYEDLLLRGR